MKTINKIDRFYIIALLVCALGSANVHAASFNDPSWPCQQRKVSELSIGLMWTEALPQDFEAGLNRPLSGEAHDLVVLLSLRRVPLEQAEEAVSTYSENAGAADKDTMFSIFAGVFDTLGDTRREVITGIEQYSLKQIALSERIEAARSEMRTHTESENPDFDRIDLLEEQLDWDERVFRDRARSLSYVCETPVLIEKRLYSVARMLLKHAR